MKHELREEGKTVRVLLEGEVDMHVAPELRRVLHQALDKKPAELVIDLAGVSFIDSSGIATIVEAFRHVRIASGSLKVLNCQEAVRDTFDIAGLTGILGIV